MSKVSIIGAGEVGASCATCLAERDFVNEIVIIDVKPGLAEGKALGSTTVRFLFRHRDVLLP